ncbi:RNA polymerase sigma factor [Amycolatopsis balhimycina DSM 5908]|uniref:RNA polymerase sigma factor n=1 Tax=Amycolatopsis balhimycina DSM 5908 TaxID=1081091 RepID=A0A428WRS3_AMYBA|nr:RNA polymerase sigma factor [Amycolatopsis balhimycina]RSM45771.1 RNA polymerase sigma factor [Amycolatopsis balhimycina DSM 5908]
MEGKSEPDWETVYRENVVWVYRLMVKKVGNPADAEDLTGEVFLAALKPLRANARREEVRAYLLATARTVLAAHWRRLFGREITTIGLDETMEIPDGSPRMTNGTTVPATDRRVAAILAELPERARRVLQLRFLESYSLQDAADELGVSLANVKVIQHRALRLAAQAAERIEEQA